MAREPSEEEPPKLRETTRRARDDAFGRLLGDDWVAVEPGIYRQGWLLKAYDGDILIDLIFDPSGDSIDESLMDALPTAEQPDSREEPAEDEWAPAAPRSPHRNWWRK